MNTPECMYCSFIVKLWIEEGASGRGSGVWRGHVTHVPSGNRHYVKDLNEIARFIAPYLEAMGVRPTPRPGLGRWLKFLNRASDLR